MTVAAQIRTAATADELAAAVAEEVVRDGIDVPIAARRVLDRMTPDDDAYADLLAAGLTSRGHDYLAAMRRMSDEAAQDRFRFTMRTKHGRAARAEYLERLILDGADGTPKAFMNFSDADCAAYIAKAVAAVNGWEQKRDAMETARAALAANGVDYITGLPADALTAVRAAVQEAWR